MAGGSSNPSRDDTDVIGARIGAQIVDNVVQAVFVVVGFLGLGAGGASGSDAGAVVGIVFLFAGFGGVLFYHLVLEGVWDGQTVGKRLFGIRVVREDGSECTIGAAFVRNLLEIIDGLFYYLVGFVSMAASDRRQRIGDRLAGTVVVRE